MANYGTLSVLVRADTSALQRNISDSVGGAGTTASRTFGDKFKTGLKTVAKAGAVALGAGLVGVFKTGFGEVSDYQAGLSQLQAGLKSTGGVSNTTVKQMENLASSIQGYSGQTDDSIVGSEKMLLTFTNIGNRVGKNNDIFNQATKMTADMAARMGGDASSNAVLLGKALNNPTKGITALTRVGVSFDAAQTKQIKSMQESGNMMGAQKLILAELNKEFGGSAKAFGQTMPGQIERTKRSFEDMSQDLISKLLPAISGLVKFARESLIPILSRVFGFVSNNIKWIAPLAGIVLGIVAAVKLWTIVTQAWTTIQAIANAVMASGPWGWIILIIAAVIAAVVLLIKHWDSVKKVIVIVWDAIKKAISWAWNNIIRPVFNAMKAAVNAVAGVFRWLWHSAIEPVWKGIKKAISLYWNYYIHPIFKGIQKAINVLAGVFRWLWHKAIQPIWNGIKGAIQLVWNRGIHPIFNAIGRGINVLAGVFKWLWHKVIQPVWNGIKGAINVVWGFIKRSIFTPIHNAVDALGSVFKWLWHKVIEPVWNGIKNAIMWPWNHIIKPIMEAFHNWPDKLAAVWRAFRDIISNIFDKVKKAVGTPIWFIADKILRPIIGGINWLITKIGIHPIPTDWIKNIPHFAEGGRVPGGWGGGDKVIAAVEPGEWVLTKRQAKAIGYARLAGLPHYATGGLVGGGGGEGEGGFLPPSTFSFWGAIGGALSSVGHAISGVVKKIGDVIVRSAKDLYKLTVDVLKAAAHMLRYAAAQAFKAAMAPLVKLVTPAATTKVPPGNAILKTLGMMMLQAIDKAIAFIEGNSESDEAESLAGMIAQRAVDVATKQLGKPYVFGSHGPNTFDCSGLVEYSYRMAGYPNGKIPGPRNAIGSYTGTQVKHGEEVNAADALPGDLVFYFRPGSYPDNPHHVGIATSAHEVINAPDKGIPVQRAAPFSAGGMSGDKLMVRRLVKAMEGSISNVTPEAKSIWKGLRSLGWGKFQAAGALGSMQYEDASFNPFIVQGGSTSRNPLSAGSGGYGIVQWTPGSKLADILRWGGKANTLGNQLWALDQQLKGRGPHPETYAGRMLRNAKSPYEAGLRFANLYERMGTDTAAGRAAAARGYYERLNQYDTGGWLPPGTTLTQNLTRKPEPVLTSKQWRDLSAAAAGRGGGTHYIAGGSLDIGIDSQGRMRAWVQDMVLEEAEYAGSFDRMGGGGW